MEELRRGILRLRPVLRPFYVGGLWILLILGLAWDLKRHCSGHPQETDAALTFYLAIIGTLVFDYLIERKLRRESAGEDGDSS